LHFANLSFTVFMNKNLIILDESQSFIQLEHKSKSEKNLAKGFLTVRANDGDMCCIVTLLSDFKKIYKNVKITNNIRKIDNLCNDYKVDLLVYGHSPRNLSKIRKIHYFDKKYLFITECHVIAPWSYKPEIAFFDLIFTFEDIPNLREKIIHINTFFAYCENVKDKIDKYYAKNKINKLTLISSYKFSLQKNQLYTKKNKLVQWYDENNANFFDLYGFGWNKKPQNIGGSFLQRLLVKCIPTLFFYIPTKKIYKGILSRKHDVLSKYLFNICFENATNIPGYITEKIFDSFITGSIPIFSGNIDKSNIPKNTYIDFNSFDSIEEAHRYLINLNEDEIKEYQYNMKSYIKREIDNDKIYSCKTMSNTVIDSIQKSNNII